MNKYRRYVAPVAIILSLAAIILVAIAINGPRTATPHLRAVSGHPDGGVLHVGSVSTTTRIAHVTTTSAAPVPATAQTTTTTPKVTTVTRSVSPGGPPSAPPTPTTTTTGVTATTGPSSPYVSTITAGVHQTFSGYGTLTAPDGTTCTNGPGLGCLLLIATVTSQNNVVSPVAGSLVFDIYNTSGIVIGAFTPRVNGQMFCLLDWYGSDAIVSSSPDCAGSVDGSEIVDGFHYGASFSQTGYIGSTTGDTDY